MPSDTSRRWIYLGEQYPSVNRISWSSAGEAFVITDEVEIENHGSSRVTFGPGSSSSP